MALNMDGRRMGARSARGLWLGMLLTAAACAVPAGPGALSPVDPERVERSDWIGVAEIRGITPAPRTACEPGARDGREVGADCAGSRRLVLVLEVVETLKGRRVDAMALVTGGLLRRVAVGQRVLVFAVPARALPGMMESDPDGLDFVGPSAAAVSSPAPRVRRLLAAIRTEVALEREREARMGELVEREMERARNMNVVEWLDRMPY